MSTEAFLKRNVAFERGQVVYSKPAYTPRFHLSRKHGVLFLPTHCIQHPAIRIEICYVFSYFSRIRFVCFVANHDATRPETGTAFGSG